MPDNAESPFLSLVRSRCSCRAYDPDRPVADEAIAACLEAARLAPSACNRQPWRFVVVTDAAQRARIYDKGRLVGIRHEWLQGAPVIVALCVRKDILTHTVAPAFSGIPYYLLDAGIAGEHFVLAATELGLGTCWIGWFSEKSVKRILGVPRAVRVVSLLALGYPAGSATGQTAGPREPLATIAFRNCWGESSSTGKLSKP